MNMNWEPVVHFMHETSHAVLSTLSVRMAGYPFGTAIPLVLDPWQQPLLLISALAEHSKNLYADARCSVCVVQNQADAHQAQRVTLVGSAQAQNAAQLQALLPRLQRYMPSAPDLLQLDFTLYAVQPVCARPIAGLGRMGWIESEFLQQQPFIAPETEARLLTQTDPECPNQCRILGLDPWGLDAEVQSKGSTEPSRVRWQAPHSLSAEQWPEFMQTALNNLRTLCVSDEHSHG